MSNGQGKHNVSEKVEVTENIQTAPIINIDNKGAKIQLEWKHIVVAFGLITSSLGTVGLGGYFFMPAKQADLDAVNVTVKQLQVSVDALGNSIAQLQNAVENIVRQQPATVSSSKPAKKSAAR